MEHWRINVIMYVKYLAQWLAYTKQSINVSFYYSKGHTDFKDKAHKELSEERGIHGGLHITAPLSD